MRYHNLLLCLILLSCCAMLWSQHEKAGTAGFAFMKMNYSARALGLANAYTGLADDGDAVFFNTAGLTHIEERHLKTNYMNYIEGLQGGSMVYVSDYGNGWKIAPFVQFLASDKIERRTALGEVTGSFETSDTVVGIGVAKTISEYFTDVEIDIDLGINVKYHYQKLAEYDASAFAVDISIMHQTQNPNLTIGAVLKNLGAQLSYFTDDKRKEKMPKMAVVGASYNFFDVVSLNLDICRPFDNDFFGRIGSEWNINKHFALRAGYDTRGGDYKTDESMDFVSGIAMGAGFNWNQYSIDYAVSSMGSLGAVQQVSVAYRF